MWCSPIGRCGKWRGLLPLDEQELLAVNGVGRARLERYGGEFLRVLNEYAQEHGKNS